MEKQDQRSMIIIGAGIAGLSMGVYAQMNGYKSQIFEMHTRSGGLMTAWKRKGYTIDGCIHWLTGSSKDYDYYKYWEEIGLIQGKEIINPEIFSRVEGPNGEVVNLYSNVDQLEKHLLEVGPADEKPIKEMCKTIRGFTKWNPSIDSTGLKSVIPLATVMPALMKYGKMTMKEFGEKFQTPILRFVFSELWFPEMSAVGLLMTLAMLNNNGAGYPIGGSIPMADSVEEKYKKLGGVMHYGTPVEKIIVEDKRAVGIRLTDGREYRADVIVSAADGYATIFKMLDGKFLDEKVTELYEKAPAFPALVFMGFGVKREFNDLPKMTSGLAFFLKEPFTVAGEEIKLLETCIFNYDPTLAPEGKTVMTVMFPSDYQYWKDLSNDSEHYEAEKQQAALHVIRGLTERFPGLEEDVEMIDVATPVTFERYTGNWKGSFEGWLPTPTAMMKPIKKMLPGLENFYMVGQWVQAGGGLPSGAMTAREVMKSICKADRVKFKISVE